MGQRDRVIQILRVSPFGLSATDLATRMGTSLGQISSVLSKMVAYGFLNRTGKGGTAIYVCRTDDVFGTGSTATGDDV